MQNSSLQVFFPRKGKSQLLGYVLKTSVHTYVQDLVKRVCKTLEEEEENTITFRLKCIVIA